MGFFDDLSRKASETYKNTAEKTNKLTREMKLKSLINDDKNRIEKIYTEIGKKVYEKHLLGENFDIKVDLVEECSQIDAYTREIEDMRMEILSLKDLRLCSNCSAEIALNARFCPKCGAVQEEDKTMGQTAENTVNTVTTDVNNVTNEINQEQPIQTDTPSTDINYNPTGEFNSNQSETQNF